MRFKPLLLAATGLLALAGANAQVDSRDALQQREVKVAASEHAADVKDSVDRRGEVPCPPCFRLVGRKCAKQPKFCSNRTEEVEDYESKPDESVDVEAPSTEDEDYESENSIDVHDSDSDQAGAAPAPTFCLRNCVLALSDCIHKCGGTDDCERKCRCALFSDPKHRCRVMKCVNVPRDCSALDLKQDQSIAARASTPCQTNCIAPWRKCVRECGSGQECEHKCSCTLFSNPNLECRVRNCVEAPQGCPSLKDVQARSDEPPVELVETHNPGTPPYPGGSACPTCLTNLSKCIQLCGNDEACKNSCNCSLSGQVFCSHCGIPCKNVAVEARDDVSTRAPRGLPGFPTTTNQCGACIFGYDRCKKNCRPDDKACMDDCGCLFKAQYHCLGCGMSCPKTESAVASRNDIAVHAPRGLPGFPNNGTRCGFCLHGYGHCKQNCFDGGKGKACVDECDCDWSKVIYCNGCGVSCLSSKPAIDARGDISVGDVDPAIVGPGPIQHDCKECGSALDGCKKKCPTPGTCDESCNCKFKDSKKCKGCNVPCTCGDSCPRLSAVQRRFDSRSLEDENVDEESLALQNVAPGNPCNLCKASLVQCQRHCNKQPACLNYCSCMHRDVFPTCKECKLSCTPTVETESSKEPGLALLNAAPATTDPYVCDSCISGVRLCQGSCVDADCANACACAFKNNAPQCRKCDIPCNSAASLQYGSVESQAVKPCNGMCIPVPVPPYCLPVYGCPTRPPPSDKREVGGITAVEAVPNPCVVCRTGIKSCQNKCNGDNGCENQCSCTFKKTLQCKECDIPCDSAASRAYDVLVSSHAAEQGCSPMCMPISVPPYCLPAYGCQPLRHPPAAKREIEPAAEEKIPPCKICAAGNKACQKKCGEDWECKLECKKAWMSVKECRQCIWEEDE